MRRLILVTLAALTVAPLAAQDPARTITLTLDEAIAISKRSNPAYLEAVNSQQRTALGVRTAYGQFLPQVSSNLGFGWREGRPTFFEGQQIGAGTDILSSNYGIGVGVNYSLFTFLGPKQAKAQLDAAQSTTVSQEQQLRLQVTNEYFNAVQAVRAADLQDSLVTTQTLQLNFAQARESVGSGTPLDTKRADVAVQQQVIAALGAHNAADQAKLALFETLGTPLTGDVTLTTELAVTEPAFKFEDLMADARQQSPALAANRASQRSAEISRRQATSRYLPSIGLSTGLGGQTSMNTDATGDARTWPFAFSRNPLNFSAGFSLTLWDGYSREQQVQSASLNISSAQQEVRRTELSLNTAVNSGLKQLVLDYKTVQLRIRAAATAKEALLLAQERYRVGATAYIDLSTALDQYQNAENQTLVAIYTYHRDFAALEAAVGRPLR